MLRNFNDYIPCVKAYGDEKEVSIKSNKLYEVNMMAAIIMIVAIMVIVLSIALHVYYPKINIDSGIGGSLAVIAVTLMYLYRDKIILAVKGYDRWDRQMISGLSHFIWVNRGYVTDTAGRITDSVIASYHLDGTDVIISLDAHGLPYSQSIQEMEVQLSSLFSGLRYVDKQIHADKTDYIFSTLKNRRVTVDA
jgi:hypothetical protein